MFVHSGVCLMQLPKVFNLKRRPWIDMDGAETAEIEHTVFNCPSGALAIEGKETPLKSTEAREAVLTPGGPVTFYGKILVKNPKGNKVEEMENVSFCRCKRSKNFPYCDGSHAKKAE